MRLNAYLARAGVASRRGADELIKAGRVKVNSEIGQLNTVVKDSDFVTVDNQSVRSQKLRYILLNKPRNTVTTLHDPEKRPTVIDVLKIDERVVPVGRLDTNTTGVLVLTNDGKLVHKLMHPSFEIDKVYEAQVQGIITSKTLALLSNPIQLSDGPTIPARARKISDNKIELIIHEGRNHQVKRMLEAVNLPVKKLHRSKYGLLDVIGLKSGQWRELTDREVDQLKQG